jgi:4-amino-4-deoxy-L-arabinose transferase-like glycosyltransferase
VNGNARSGASRFGPILREVCDIAAFAIPAIAYVASVSHEPGSWDTAEFQGVPYILGISHPTGFPFYVLLGWVWTHLFAIDSVAFRTNVMSAAAIATATATAYAVAVRLGAHRAVALPAALWYAFTQDVWSHANRAEPQDLAVLCQALAIYAFVRWMQGDRDRWFAAAFALVGLGMAAHPNAIWLLPGLFVGAIVAKRRPSFRLLAGSLILTILGLALYLYLPLRSAYIVSHGLDPTLPLGTDGGIFWNYHNPSTPGGLLLDLTGNESSVPSYFLASFNPVHLQDALWAFINGIGQQFGAFALILTFLGLAAAWRRDWRTTLFLCIACSASLLFSVTYTAEGDIGRYRLMALWAAVPFLGALVPSDAREVRATILRYAMIVFLSIGAGFSFYSQRGFFEHAPGEGGRWVIDVVKPLVPPGAVLVVNWLDATSLAYGAYVDGSLAGRIIVSGFFPDRMASYKEWAQTHRVFVLVNPNDVTDIQGAKSAAQIDAYHELWEVQR